MRFFKLLRSFVLVSRGWVLNEIFRRVDPQGRTLGEFMREEVCGPLTIKAFIGVKREELADFADLTSWGLR